LKRSNFKQKWSSNSIGKTKQKIERFSEQKEEERQPLGHPEN
jgi:hypothetical protein